MAKKAIFYLCRQSASDTLEISFIDTPFSIQFFNISLYSLDRKCGTRMEMFSPIILLLE